MSSASEIREWYDMQAAKFEASRVAWELVVAATALQAFRYAMPGLFWALPSGYRRARRKYGYRRFPSRRARRVA